MATRELAFNSKIKNLKEYVHQIYGSSPPAGQDVSNTIKYFSNNLLNILKDAPNIQGEAMYGAKHAMSNMRQAIFPTLNYSGLFDVICQLLPAVHLVKIGNDTLTASVLQLVSCIIPFITWSELVQLPYKLTMMLPVTQDVHHSRIVSLLCTYLLPNTLGRGVEGNSAVVEAVSAIIMIVLQYCKDAKLHSLLIETLLPLCEDLYKHMFTVVAYGTPSTIIPAISLLFHYWPQLKRLCVSHTLMETYSVQVWESPRCQRTNCINKVAQPFASKMCTDPNMCVSECLEPPPVVICIDCYDTVAMRSYDPFITDLLMSSEHMSIVCSNKNCCSSEKRAAHVCSSQDCIKMNRFRPVSLCTQCHIQRHPGTCGFVQNSIDNIWNLDLETQSYIVDGIVNLLREAEPAIQSQIDPALLPLTDDHVTSERWRNPVNSRYGVLMLKELCRPKESLSVDSLGRLLGMLFRWFQCTGSSTNPNVSNLLDRLKTDFMTEWLQDVKKTHYEVILSTLLPHPPDFAKVGGQWERLSSRTEQMKEGLEKLIMLGPYDIVTYEVWDYIMPYWLESIRTELNLKEREEIKIVLRQTFDIEMSPLPFLLDKMYHFIDERFESTNALIQEQGLQWLQILTSVDICIPFVLLLKMFRDGTVVLLNSTEELEGERSTVSVKLNCFILELDILLRQSELSRLPSHAGITQNKSKEMFILMNDMLKCIKPLQHDVTCQNQRGTGPCDTCQHVVVFYQLVFNLLRIVSPRLESSLPVIELKQIASSQHNPHEESDDQPDVPAVYNLFSTLTQEMSSYFDADIKYYIVSAQKVLFVHGQCLQFAYKTHPAVIDEFLQQKFIPAIWNSLNSKECRVSQHLANMLFHAVAIGDGYKHCWNIVDNDFGSKSWQIRYAVADKCRMIWEFSNGNLLSKNQLVMTSLAHVFCQYITLLHDNDHNVAQRAVLYLHLLSESSLKAIIKCMSVQFDAVVKDRQLIIHKLQQLQNAIPTRIVFTWSFFLARLQQLFLEAEMSDSGLDAKGEQKEKGSLVKLSHGQNLDQMIRIAHFANMKCDSIHSIRDKSTISERSVSVKHHQFYSNSNNHAKDKERRNVTANLLKPKNKKKSTQQSHDPSMFDIDSCQSDETGKLILSLHRTVENEKLDPSLLHLLISSIMKHMSTETLSENDDKEMIKMQTTMEHTFHLLGYSEGKFYISPSRLRSSPILDAVLTNLSKFLDKNVAEGQKFLLDWLHLLRYSSSPQKYSTDHQPSDYTLLYLPKSLYKQWLQALLIILYKYNFSKVPELASAVNYLVNIVLNTLKSIHHVCKANEDGEIGENYHSFIRSYSSNDDGDDIILPATTTTIIEEKECDSPISSPKKKEKTTGNKLTKQSKQERKYEEKPMKMKKGKHEMPPNAAAFADLLSNPQGTKKLDPQPSTSKKPELDFADLLSNPQSSPKQKPSFLHRQQSVDQTLDLQLTRKESEQSFGANMKERITPEKARRETKGDITSDIRKMEPELKKTDTRQRLGSVFRLRKQQSRKDFSNDLNQNEEDMSQSIQSAAAAMENIPRSKRVLSRISDGTPSGGSAHLRSVQSSSSCEFVSKLCSDCNRPVEEYDEDIIVLCVVAIETYLNHQIDQAAPMVYDMIYAVCRIASKPIYTWQTEERSTFIPGNIISASHQFIRCSLHQLLPYKIMSELLVSSDDSSIFEVIVLALTDFPELTFQNALLYALEGINEKEEIKRIDEIINNLKSYLSSITAELTNDQTWPKIVDQLEILFRKITTDLSSNNFSTQHCTLSTLLSFMSTTLKLPMYVNNIRGDRLMETFSKLISHSIQTHTYNLTEFAKLAQQNYRVFNKERDKTILSRMIVNELLQVIKYKSPIPESNVLILLEIVCMDCGSTLLPTYITNEIPNSLTNDMMIETGITDIMRVYLHDCIEFISDLHALHKLKGHTKLTCLHEDTFGGLLKTGIAQIVALEFSRLIRSDVKAIQRVLPWLYNQPNALQRGPREFIESVDHLRFLCWLYIGALTHHAVAENVLSTKCQPLPLDDTNYISVIVISIMTGFVDYSALSVEFMSSLFYAFNLCQVWTMYCDCLTMDGLERTPEGNMDIKQLVFDFWAKVTPTILSMMSHSKVMVEMVNIHILTMMETLQEAQSSVLVKLFPLWKQLLYSNHNKLPTNVRVRLQTIENWQPPVKRQTNKAVLFEWIKKVQFKLAQIELQSSTAASKFLPI